LNLRDLGLVKCDELVSLVCSGFSLKFKTVYFGAEFENKRLLHTWVIILDV